MLREAFVAKNITDVVFHKYV